MGLCQCTLAPVAGPLDMIRSLIGAKPGAAPDGDTASNEPSNIAIERLRDAPATDAEEVARQMQGLYDIALRARSGREAAWFKRLLAYCGEGKLRWDASTKALKPEGRKPTWALEEYWNEIRPTVDHAVAIQTRDNLEFSASATNHGESDIAKSECATSICEHLFRDLHMRKKYVAALRLSKICGTSAWEPEWDAGDGPMTPAGPDGPFTPAGRHKLTILSPFEIVVDPSATGDDDYDYIFTIREVTVAWGRDRFPDHAKEIQPEDIENHAPDEGMWFLRQYQELGRRTGFGTQPALVNTSTGMSRDSLLLKKCYIPSSPKLPNGRLIMMLGNHVVWDRENPIYPDDPSSPRGDRRSPLFVFRHRWTGKSFWGESLVEDIIGPQETLNRLVSKGLAIVYSNQRGILVVQPGVKITDEPCPVIFAKGGNTPPEQMIHQVPAMPFPPGILEFINLAKAEIQSAGNVHSPTRGEGNPGDSGVLVRELQEQDSTVLAPTKKDDDEVAADAMKFILLLAKRWWDAPRMVRTLGPDMETEIQEFSGADLSDSTDVWVETDTGMPHNRVSSWMMVTQLLQTPFFQLPASQQQPIARMLRIGGGSGFLSDVGADEKRARRMISRIKKGTPQQVAFYDDFDVINHVFSTWMKSEEYETLVTTNPQIKALAEQVLSAASMAQFSKAQSGQPPAQAGPGGPPAQAGAAPGPGGAQPASDAPAAPSEQPPPQPAPPPTPQAPTNG